tara:strand:- start:6126 stop:7007 length:882 start_codon:yes stop_codon:yes gene_type:complete
MISENYKMISVIVPCFNSGKTIKRTINSIKNQSWDKKEIILVNDGSNDKETLEILNSFKNDSLVKLINQKNKGLSAARNKGVKFSKGDYLFFLDSDDWIEENALEELFFNIQNERKSSYVFSDCFLEGESKGTREKIFNLFEQMFINQIPYSIFIPRKVFIENGFYDENMKLGYEDWELNIRLASKKVLGKSISKPLFHYNVSNSGMLISKSILNHIKIWKYIKSKNKNFYKFKNIVNVFYKWRLEESNYPLILVFIWYLMLNYLPEFLMLRTFLFFRKIKFLLKKLIYFFSN